MRRLQREGPCLRDCRPTGTLWRGRLPVSGQRRRPFQLLKRCCCTVHICFMSVGEAISQRFMSLVLTLALCESQQASSPTMM